MSRDHRSLRLSASALVCALWIAAPLPSLAAQVSAAIGEDPLKRQRSRLPLERPDDPPMPPAAAGLRTTRAAGVITFGSYVSFQVNVNASGDDVVGDAANEPSLAVNPFDRNLKTIGWRQFDNIASNFREAGYGYTNDGGETWTAGEIQPGVFRSDPVLDVDGSGTVFYNSLTNASGPLSTQVFRSFTNGSSWSAGVSASGGDKQWMTIDRDLDNVYQAWSTSANPYAPNTFNKSIDDGDSYGAPSHVPGSPIWGTLDVDRNHTLYLAGFAEDARGALTDIVVARSTDAQDQDGDPPIFTTVPVDLGGYLSLGGPNPSGLLGQVWVAVDKSTGPRSGWVYVLASVLTPTDPADVMFIRSTDGGQTWSVPKRVNDDATRRRKFQWFGTMSVSPSGRIDAVWNDTRGSNDSTVSALFYSYSADGGTTWSPNVQVTPTWSSVVGFPNQDKIGDYYDTTSDDEGVDVAYAATFNGGQDIYYLRIPNTVTGIEPPPATTTLRLDSAPNPFARTTTIRFDAPAAGSHVRVEVFDLAGQRVATLVDGFRAGGAHSIAWDGRRADGADASPGVYLCRLTAGSTIQTRKLLRVR